ncbi:MAG TPA: tetratricopeptide repeat protein [Syntrophorhabdaceae bacterium]|jgi:Flp pilus assembly protein TadD
MKKGLVTLLFSVFFLGILCAPAIGAQYVASKTSFRYHLPMCTRAGLIKSANLIRFNSRAEAKKAGYVPCSLCGLSGTAVSSLPGKGGAAEGKTRVVEEDYEKGKALVGEKKYGEALPYLERAVREAPGNGDAWFQCGVCRSELGHTREALEAFRRVVALDPARAAAHFSLGVLYGRLKKYDAAIGEYRQALRLQPDDGPAHFNLGVVYLTLERYEDAASALKDAVRLRPEESLGFNNLGVVLSNLKRYEEAVDAFREAIRLNPGDGFAGYNLGVISLGLGRYKEAVDSLSRASLINPDDDATRYHLGVAYLKAGDRESSTGQYKELRKKKSLFAARLYEELQKE